jgi:hypothetical protein
MIELAVAATAAAPPTLPRNERRLGFLSARVSADDWSVFRWADRSLPFFDGLSKAALTDTSLGFFSTGTPLLAHRLTGACWESVKVIDVVVRTVELGRSCGR